MNVFSRNYFMAKENKQYLESWNQNKWILNLYLINDWLKIQINLVFRYYRFDTGMVKGDIWFLLRAGRKEQYIEVDISRNEEGSRDFDARF